MKNITVTVDDETYRSARIRAAELDTSVSAMVREYLRLLSVRQLEDARSETAGQRRDRLLREVIQDFDARGMALRVADQLSREELFDRAAAQIDAEVKRRNERPRDRRS